MQAIMLAAGMGRRLGKYTKDNTKCLLKVCNKTLLERVVDSLKIAGINKLILVVGYKADNLKNFVNRYINDIDIVFIENKDYMTTNNIYSFYLAKDYLIEEDTILLESDLIFDRNLIKELVDLPYNTAAVVAPYEPWMDGTLTLVDKKNNILEFVEKKDFDFDKAQEYFKTVNIYKFSKKFSSTCYIPFLEAYIKAYGNNEYYELVLKAIANLSKTGLKAFKITNQKWYEIDDVQDLDIATNIFAKGQEMLSLYQKRYGGYWRFSNIKDFCYLVNSYFPPKNMIDKLKYSFYELLTQYPSNMYVQSINASRMFNVDENQIIVGNGAAELINFLKSIVKGNLAVPTPTFNEYIRCFPNCNIIPVDTSIDDYKFNKDNLINCIREVDNIAIINPDNPSGSFLEKDDLLEIINICNEQNKYIIIDESFIDFAEADKRYTLINSQLLNKYKKLIVIKSISKSYGVPGMRLGVLATGNKNIIDTIKKEMPVWNINSFAEYFLQIITLYQKEYQTACNKIAEERGWLYKELNKISYLKPYESQANYILCKVTNNYTATKIAMNLLEKHQLYIKDLSGKKGFENKQYIRIAVRNREDNEILIGALKEYKGEYL
ncbi:aminotransferase [Clostridium botulinum A2B7 92]|uniref:aminotransferase class I/II-fold pyridoxal phosphate-dependent enzyme n=1 Tax=Clostridium botulinum TaxID=1491 RepID=UPI0007DF0B71|nr:aminotransferase class I/II-fold pyridoxal phosphate-dependent enzyme [Clostridium botulinum]KEI97161.1 aminotransferase [Clostridium botulinum A2B7 92]